MGISRNFQQRFLVSFIGIILILTLIYYSPFGIFQFLFTSLIAAVIGLALWEFYHITKVNGYTPQSYLGIGFSIAYIYALFLNHLYPMANAIPEAVLGLILIVSFLHFFKTGENPFVNLAMTFFGIFYLTIPLGCLISINFYFPTDSTQDGRWWLVYVFTVTKMNDIGAYFCGKLAGKTKLAPYISPKKTVEGAIGGFALGILTSYIFYTSTHLNLTFWQSLWLGGLTGILAQLGDLSESLLKRDMKVKDSNQLPGLGGILDIVDSLVFTTPLIYIFLKIS